MYLFLIRHPESEKNIQNSFSSILDNEKLTSLGTEQSKELAKCICNIVDTYELNLQNIYCANSARAISSAEIIAKSLNIGYVICKDLVSTKAGKLAGIGEKDAHKTHSDFVKQLYLYRKGLFNAYNFNVAEGKEDKKNFEGRVIKCLNKIINSNTNKSDLIVIIAHRSPITTILTDFAKKYYGYPKRFLGFIQLDLGGISWLKKENEKWDICGVNQTIEEFISAFNNNIS